MERTINNNVLRQALAPQEKPGLPSNFAYTTMRRIRREQRESQRRQQLAAFIIVVAIAALGIGGLIYAFGSVIWRSLVAMTKQPDALSLAPATLFCLAFFALINHLLARHYISSDRTAPQ